MNGHRTLLPGTRAPQLSFALADGGHWSLEDAEAKHFVLIDFYRGLHCPRCQLHLVDVKNKLARFTQRGVAVVAVSMDGRDRAEAARDRWGLGGLTLGYGLSEDQARAWGLYLTEAMSEAEPARFSEPALIMVQAGSGRVYSAVYGTNPLNRIHASDILEGIDAVLARDYPPRGTLA
ncbi:redoxin domain-containing protein [Pelagerythrobacter marensis]|uniref:AhpC/TSA family protein n=1 Tax=Pelagerythrobacter marensis TaxID=543877 RepID=A0A0G3X8V8_9SPHN|nr:redoxin domain-containing protein [Pelagerythrobacter marensis]AKM07024.1 AhpC/TSA family protein [Pelagerythrobacter marensis]